MDSCGLTKKAIAEKCGIPLRRFYNILAANRGIRMDRKEFLAIRQFCMVMDIKKPSENDPTQEAT